MADFTVKVVGATLATWLDPGTLTAPSRLNARPGRPHRRWRVDPGGALVLKAVVDGVEAPLDAALGGRLFAPFVVEAPDAALPFTGFSSPSGQSSLQLVTMIVAGHYTLGVRRTSGGLEHVHLDVG